MVKVKKIPQRICVGCRQTREKREMLRIVRTPDYQVVIDPTGKRSGRGAYICKDPKCFETALKQGQLQRALKVEIPEDLIEELRRIITQESKRFLKWG